MDLGGHAGHTPPYILSFSHTFLPKSAHIGGPYPPNGSMPPMGNPGSTTVTVLIMVELTQMVIFAVGPEGCQIELEDGNINTVNVNISKVR